MAEIDWDAPCRLLGGHLAEVPPPIVHRWPTSTLKRKVTVSVRNFMGYIFGAGHYHVAIEEEDNPVWDSRLRGVWGGKGHEHEPEGWRRCWDDLEGAGRKIESKFNNMSDARQFIKNELAQFSRRTYHVRGEHDEPVGRYLARWEGD